MLTAVVSDVINDIMHCIKGAAIAHRKIEDVRKLFLDAFYDRSVIFPTRWEIWRSMITQYRLYDPPLGFVGNSD